MGRGLSYFLSKPDTDQPLRGASIPTVAKYTLGLSCAAAAIAAVSILKPENQIGYLSPFILGVAITAWYGGVGPALLCHVSGLIYSFFYLFRPWIELPGKPGRLTQLYGLVLYFVIGKLVLFLTASMRWNRDLRKNEQRLRLIASTTSECIWEWDLKSDAVTRSGNVHGLFGSAPRPVEENIQWWRDRLHPEERDFVWNGLRQVIAGVHNRWEADYRLRRPDGSYLLVSDKASIVRDHSGKALRLVGGMSDVTAHRMAEQQLAYDALHDSLTGLPNRELFRELLEQTLGKAKTAGRVAVLFLDFDRFKIVNDSLGHHAGDRVLRALSKRIELALQPGETAARFGGDEFTVLLRDVSDAAQAKAAADRILQSLSIPYDFEGHSLLIHASIGIAMAAEGMYPEELLRYADLAMYRAKARGRDRCEVFEPAVEARTMNVLQLESEIRKSLVQGDFRIYYQPIVGLSSGMIAGFEALLRWQHPERGILLPGEFLDLAEESGLILELGQRALEVACGDLQNWRSAIPAARELTISVNLAGKQFVDPDLVRLVRSVLHDTQLGGDALILELTENIILETDSLAAVILQQLSDSGIRLAIDDFGQGHSSFGRLQDLPISILKIDGSFVNRIRHGKPEIVDAVIALARQLKLEVTAESVETEEQFMHLKRARCTTAQGLYFSAALTAEAAADLLRENRRWSPSVLSAAANS